MNIIGTKIHVAKKLKEYVESKRDHNGTAVSAAFIKDGEIVSAFVCGTQDGNPEQPATINDLFNIGSISKLYCTLAIMKLVEMGKVDLDKPVVEYLPRFTMKDERYKQITLRMCLNHSTGMPGMNMKYFASSKWLDESHYDDFYDCFSKSKITDNPGNASVYCNDGFMLAEMVVVKVSGMSYIKFVQEYITIPMGAPSTCSGERIAENRVHVRANGNPNEYMMNTGAGGILTDIIDCARLGYLFIDSKNIFKPESLNEMTFSQGRSFLPEVATNIGLGWYFVDFSLEPYNFGKNTLAQGGATILFSSFLIVSRKYNLAAAISFTNDNKMIPYTILCELCSMLLDEYGINVREKAKEAAIEVNKVSIPSEFMEKFSGMYYNYYRSFRVGFVDDLLKIQFREPNGWGDIVTDAFFDGRRFTSGNRIFVFEEYKDSFYLIEEETPLEGRSPMGQKLPPLPPVKETWKKRVGKKYIVCDAHPNDIVLNDDGFYVTIKEYENEDGLLFFLHPKPYDMTPLPVITSGDNETEMVLNTPLGSRDGFAPFIYEKDGIEYLYALGYNLIDTAYLKPLQTGQVISEKGRINKIFSIAGGCNLNIDIPTGVRVIIFDSDLKQKYDSVSGQKISETCDGFILFINEGAMNVSVEVC